MYHILALMIHFFTREWSGLSSIQAGRNFGSVPGKGQLRPNQGNDSRFDPFYIFVHSFFFGYYGKGNIGESINKHAFHDLFRADYKVRIMIPMQE
ncbi:MAG: hypothetical protein Q4G69_04185 [Planctomycetia bacterium]|nr:hypothetical protein [Planctomycetia bacterium]